MFHRFKQILASVAEVPTMVGEYLEHFGHRIEQRNTPTTVDGTTVEFADTASDIGAIMLRDAERQKAESHYFNDGMAPVKSKYFRNGNVRLPRFTPASHLQ